MQKGVVKIHKKRILRSNKVGIQKGCPGDKSGTPFAFPLPSSYRMRIIFFVALNAPAELETAAASIR